MSYSLDVNILLYASDRSSKFHQPANRFLESCTARPDLLCLPWPALMSYIRISTHPRIFETPLAPEEAMRNVAALLALPHVRAVSERDGFLDVYKQVTANLVARGNAVPDAHLATILLQHGVRTLYTKDRDFRKFEGFDVRDPFS